MNITIFVVLVLFVTSAFAEFEENRGVEDPDLFEGDIKLTEGQRAELNTRGERANIKFSLWPNAQIVYDVEPSIANVPEYMATLKLAIAEYHQKTCIRFKKRTTERDYVSLYKGGGCWSLLGRTGGKQKISLGVFCWEKGIVIHELAHALGFHHEQSRPDRDDYVEIKYENLLDGTKNNFKKHSVDSQGTPYDYGSVMHYGPRAFSKNGRPTIVPKKQGVTIGQRRGLSRIDVIELERLYKCGDNKPTPPSSSKPPPVPSAFKCDFQSNCGFVQRKDDKFDWTRRQYGTPSSQTGPSGDHTSGKGFYMYIEASPPRERGDNAVIEKTVTFGSNQCLTFYYHMYGFHIGTLNVFVGSSKVFTKSGPQGNKWIKASVRLVQSGTQKLSFEGIRANGYLGDIAIDDISIGNCVALAR